MRNVDPCPCDKAVLAHEPEEYSQLTACAEAALVITAASKTTKIKSAFRIFQLPLFPGPYSMSTFKVFIPGFYYSGDRGRTPFPAACAGYGLLPLRRYCTGVQILNKVQPAPGQVDILDNYSKNLGAAGTRTANASGPRTLERQFCFRESAVHRELPQFAC